MLRNYFKISFRSLTKNPLSTFINTLGLAMAIGCCIVVYAYLHIELSMEAVHRNADRIFMVTTEVNRDGDPELFGTTAQPIGLKLKEDFPQISHMSRVEDRSVVIKRGENVFREWTRMVDPDFVEMLDFDLKRGSLTSLKNRENVIINVQMAEKYFGDEDPIGQTLLMKFSGGKVLLNVSGVVDVRETETSMIFNFLTNYELLELVDESYEPVNWAENINGTFIMTKQASDIEVISSNVSNYPGVINSAQDDWNVLSIGFEPLITLFERSEHIRYDISRNSDGDGQIILPIIALLMLVLACLNYLNLAISSAVKRLKEIGIRKVIGASRSKLITQFMIENILVTFIAIGMGTIIGGYFFLPGLNNLFGTEMDLNVLQLDFYIFAVILLFSTAIASGAYPALYVSKFQVVSILKGKLMFGRRNVLSKVFMTLQFVIACTALVSGVFFALNSNYQYERHWGYNRESTLLIPTPDYESLLTFKNELEQRSDIESISAGGHHLGYRVSSTVIDLPDRKFEVRRMDVEPGYIQTMQLELLEGRDFRTDHESDLNSVIINETFARTLDWEDPILQTFKYDSVQYRVIGVLKDFHYYSYWNDIEPAFLRVGDKETYNMLALRSNSDNLVRTFEEIEQAWLQTFPEEPFNGRYQSDLFRNYFRSVNGHKYMMGSVALIALIMTCLGLYGLVGLNVSGRLKEFSVRKVLGADLLAMSKAVSSHFMLIILIALSIGAPVSYWLINKLFDAIYTYHMPMHFGPVLFSIALILLTIGFTVSSHLWRVARANPVEGLRAE